MSVCVSVFGWLAICHECKNFSRFILSLFFVFLFVGRSSKTGLRVSSSFNVVGGWGGMKNKGASERKRDSRVERTHLYETSLE